MFNWFTKFIKKKSQDDFETGNIVSSVSKKILPLPAGTSSPQRELVNELMTLKEGVLKEGTVLFHGCVENSFEVDIHGQKLTGTRKWLSQDFEYAADYAYYQGGGAPLLWVCTLAKDTRALIGNQTALIKVTNWGYTAPWNFPDQFLAHAQTALQTSETIAFLDHFHAEIGGFSEVLISNPSQVLSFKEIIRLPDSKDEAREFMRNRFHPSR